MTHSHQSISNYVTKVGHKVTYDTAEPGKISVHPHVVGKRQDGAFLIKPLELSPEEAHELGDYLQQAAKQAGFKTTRKVGEL